MEKLQRYDLVERIAAGGMGEVFRARATGPHGFEKTLAVKRILPELSTDKVFVARFVRESKLAVSLSHANIVQVFDLGRSGDDLFLVMEYVHGTDLSRLLTAAREAGRSIPVPLALLIVAEAAQGLAYAHGRYDLEVHPGEAGHVGVIHCDISPSNLLLSYAGEVKLTDFGVAQLVDHSRKTPSQAQHVMGKWRYMAPEQIRGESVDARTDLYALGVVLYEILTGRRAFSAEGVKPTCEMVLQGDVLPTVTYRPDIPPALGDLVASLMAVNPKQRPADARALLERIAHIQGLLNVRVTAFDLGALVRELMPPPQEERPGGKLSALFQPVPVDHTRERSDSLVHHRTPAASFVARRDPTGSSAITQWVPTDQHSSSGRLGGPESTRLRWRMGLTLLALMSLFLGVGLATGLKIRQPAGKEEPAYEDLAEDQLPRWRGQPQTREAIPPIERIPQQFARLLDRAQAHEASRAHLRKQGYGYLDIYVEPWAHVSIDGHPLPQPTPLSRVPVSTGTHRVVLSNPVLGKQREVQVTVAKGQVQRVEVYLVEK